MFCFRSWSFWANRLMICGQIQASIPPATTFPQSTPYSASQESTPLEHLPPPPASIQLTPLFGAAPSSHLLTLHNLYASQVSTLYWTSPAGRDNKPVITGIALKRIPAGDSASENQVSEDERRTFGAIMGLVRRVIREHFK